MIKKLCYLILGAALFTGCSKYGYVALSYPKDPMVYLPENIHQIAVVNRSLTKEEDKDDKIIEAIVTSEIAGSDRLASNECVKGVFTAANDWGGTQIIIPEKVKMYGSGTRDMPELLEWNLVAEICSTERVDALLVLETFDSNTDLLLAAATEQVAAILSTGSPKPKVPDQVKMNVLCFWRLYEPVTKTVIDQYQHRSHLTFNMSEETPPPHALPEMAFSAGVAYIQRFMPGYYTVKRELYKKTKGGAKHQFKAGYRRAEVANWTGAVEIWDELSDHEKRVTAGRACLNIAVAHEVLGNTEIALRWAQKSYEFYNDKLGREYAKVLLRRKSIEGY